MERDGGKPARNAFAPFPLRSIGARFVEPFDPLTFFDSAPIYGAFIRSPSASAPHAREAALLFHRRLHRRDREGRGRTARQTPAAGAAEEHARPRQRRTPGRRE